MSDSPLENPTRKAEQSSRLPQASPLFLQWLILFDPAKSLGKMFVWMQAAAITEQKWNWTKM